VPELGNLTGLGGPASAGPAAELSSPRCDNAGMQGVTQTSLNRVGRMVRSKSEPDVMQHMSAAAADHRLSSRQMTYSVSVPMPGVLISPRSDASESSRRPSHVSHASFNDSDLTPTCAKLVRRRTSHVVASELDSASTHASMDIDTLLRAEKARLTKKACSRAYENNRDDLLMERELITHVGVAGAMRKRSNKPAAQKVGAPEFSGITPAQDTECDDEISGAYPDAKIHVDPEDLNKFLGWVSLLKWFITVAIAVVIALLAGFLILGSHQIVQVKLNIMAELSASGGIGHLWAFSTLVAYALPTCLVSAMLVVYVAPHAGGSGIPEIKAYLNGIAMPQAFTAKAFACRSIGLLLVTSAGLFAGTEGPFAHLGGIVASFFSDGLYWRGKPLWPVIFMGHRNKCEFIAQGASMGVAAAFGAPVGGILFSLEEAASFWSRSLTWRAFLGTMIAAVVAKLTKSRFTELTTSGFIEFPDRDASFELWELGTFSVLATVTGFMGALFCNCVKRTLAFRRRFFQLGSPTSATKRARLAEVLFVVIFTMTICFWPAILMGCKPLAEDSISGSDEHGARMLLGSDDNGSPHIEGIICPGNEYSDIAFLLLNSKEAAIKTLFSREMASGAMLSIPSLAVVYVIVYGTTILTFGSAIPVGLFIPNILAGACLGRIMGQLLLDFGLPVHPGVYALMGAAGALGGFSRMTISLAVIFIEITNNMYLLLPLMLVIMWSKNLADRYGPSVYDIVLESNPDIHLLEDSLNEDYHLVLEGMTTHDICTADVVVLRAFEPYEQIIKLLLQTTFAGYPVVDAHGRLVGLVSRTQLMALLAQKQSDPGRLVSLLRLAEATPEVTHWKTPVVRAFHHFRASGLQHLCVIDEHHVLLGILTRTDFARLCRWGAEGVEEVRALIHRKQAAMAAGLIATSHSQHDSSDAGTPRNNSAEEIAV